MYSSRAMPLVAPANGPPTSQTTTRKTATATMRSPAQYRSPYLPSTRPGSLLDSPSQSRSSDFSSAPVTDPERRVSPRRGGATCICRVIRASSCRTSLPRTTTTSSCRRMQDHPRRVMTRAMVLWERHSALVQPRALRVEGGSGAGLDLSR